MKKYLLLYLFLALVFLTHYLIAGQAVYGDGIDYWAHLHTWVIDLNLDFNNEFRHNYTPVYNNCCPAYLSPEIQKTQLTSLGKTENPHPPGTALLLLPFYLLAHLFTPVRNGYSDLYQIFTGLGAIVYVTLGTYFLARISSWLAALAIVLGSPLLYYGSYDVLNSHFASFFLSSLFWYVLARHSTRPLRRIFILAAIVGFAILVRIQEVLLLIPLLISISVTPLTLALTLTVVSLINLPLLYQWQYLYGIPLPHLYLSRGHIFRGFTGSLFHPVTGLFSRTPLLLISVIGFYKNKYLFLMLLYFLTSYILVTYQGGWHDAAYGGRMFISALPLFAVFLTRLFQKITRYKSILLVILFSLLNIFSILSFVFYEKEVNSGKKTGLEEQTLLRLREFIFTAR